MIGDASILIVFQPVEVKVILYFPPLIFVSSPASFRFS